MRYRDEFFNLPPPALPGSLKQSSQKALSSKEFPVSAVKICRGYMEYKVIIQENLCNGAIYIHAFPLEPASLDEAMKFRAMNYHSDCVFIVEFSGN